MRETEAYWKALWSIALTLAVEKHLGLCPELAAPLDKLVRNEHLRSACDLFTNLLALSRDAYFAAFKDYVTHLLPAFRRIHSSIAMFIDNIDEYFEDFLASDLVDSEEQRGIYRSYWHFAQVGIALAARDLHAINNHVKIFASIRKEVFQRTFLGNPLGLQLAGSALDLQYAREDLIEIIRKNIEVERKRSLVEPAARDPWVRFFGQRRHPDRAPEHRRRGGASVAFWIRHTFRRPRDIVFIGRDLAAIDPRRRTREAVAPADHAQRRGDRAGLHHRDVAPSAAVRPRDPVPPDPPQRDPARRSWRRCPSSTTGCSRPSRAAASRSPATSSPACSRSGCSAMSASIPETAELVQYFRHPGEVPLDRDDVLPDAEHFLIHPEPRSPDRQLQSRLFPQPRQAQRDRRRAAVARRAPDPVRAQGRRARARRDPAGPGRRRELSRRSSPRRWPSAGRDLAVAYASDGDAALLVDPNPRQLVMRGAGPAPAAAALGLWLRHPLRRRCRLRRDHRRGAQTRGRAPAWRCWSPPASSRTPPPGTILVTGQFVDAWRDLLGAGGLRARPVEPHEVPRLRESDGRFDLAKPGGEAPMLRRLRLLDGPASVG